LAFWGENRQKRDFDKNDILSATVTNSTFPCGFHCQRLGLQLPPSSILDPPGHLSLVTAARSLFIVGAGRASAVLGPAELLTSQQGHSPGKQFADALAHASHLVFVAAAAAALVDVDVGDSTAVRTS